MTAAERADVMIVGGGIGGLTASIVLRNRGFATRVYESKQRFGELGVAVILSPNTLKALASLGRGIADDVARRGRVERANTPLRICRPDGALVGEANYGDLVAEYGAPQVTILRAALIEVLVDAHEGKACTPARSCSTSPITATA